MTVAGTGTLVHLPFADRAAFGSPYPEGIAVAHIDLTGDATGGIASGSVQAVGPFLYRLELMAATLNSGPAITGSYTSAHRWAADRSGLGQTAFDLSWVPDIAQDGGFTLLRPSPVDYAQIRRVPLGRTDVSALWVIWQTTFGTNVDGGLYDFDLILTYWPAESLYQPGFLASFFEAPVVPLAI